MSHLRNQAIGLVFLLVMVAPGRIRASELIQNGDFEAGNVLFGSDLMFDPVPPLAGAGYYMLGNNPNDWVSIWATMGDHTSGSGLMFIGDPVPTDDRMWFQTVNVTAGTLYDFSGWGSHVTTVNPAILSFDIDGNTIGNLDLSAETPATWAEFSAHWTATSTATVELSITDLETDNSGNDFALDDLSFQTIPELASVIVGDVADGQVRDNGQIFTVGALSTVGTQGDPPLKVSDTVYFFELPPLTPNTSVERITAANLQFNYSKLRSVSTVFSVDLYGLG